MAPTGLQNYLNVSSNYPIDINEVEEYKELVSLGYVIPKGYSQSTYTYTKYILTKKGVEARESYRNQAADNIIQELDKLDTELLSEVLEFESDQDIRSATSMSEESEELLGQLQEYEITEQYYEDHSWDSYYICHTLTDFGRIVWQKLKEQENG